LIPPSNEGGVNGYTRNSDGLPDLSHLRGCLKSQRESQTIPME